MAPVRRRSSSGWRTPDHPHLPVPRVARRRERQMLGVISASMTSFGSVSISHFSLSEFTADRSGHNLTISDPSLPVINVATTANPSYLPLKVCFVRAGQVARGKIGPEQTAKMIQFAVCQPSANAESITSVGLSLLRLERDDMVSGEFSPRLSRADRNNSLSVE